MHRTSSIKYHDIATCVRWNSFTVKTAHRIFIKTEINSDCQFTQFSQSFLVKKKLTQPESKKKSYDMMIIIIRITHMIPSVYSTTYATMETGNDIDVLINCIQEKHVLSCSILERMVPTSSYFLTT